MTYDDSPEAGPVWTGDAQLAEFIKTTTIHCGAQNMKALGLVVSGKIFFYFFSHCKCTGANDPRGGAIFDPRGMIRMIYVKLRKTILHTKYRSFGSCGFREDDFKMYFPL